MACSRRKKGKDIIIIIIISYIIIIIIFSKRTIPRTFEEIILPYVPKDSFCHAVTQVHHGAKRFIPVRNGEIVSPATGDTSIEMNKK
jgi:hypothetical protein